MALIVDFARIYALKHQVAETNTLERLAVLTRRGILQPQSHEEMVQAYGYLMRMRIENQVKALDENRPADNFLEPDGLTSIDQKLLKEIFAQIKHFQVKLSYDFTGMMGQ